MGLIDSHCHLDDKKFESDRKDIIENFKESKVDIAITCGDSIRSSIAAQKLAQEYEAVYSTAGIHPHNANDFDDKSVEELISILKKDKVIAVGEIGLDYHYDVSPKKTQINCMMRQVEMAKELDMPIIFHIREAFGDFLSLLRNKEIEQKGVMHCFSGSREVAKECIEKDMLISFAGVITFKNAHKIREVVKYVPLSKMLIETDSPYMTPVPFRGKRNEPKHVIEVAKTIAQIKEVNLDEVIKITKQNAIDLFNIDKAME